MQKSNITPKKFSLPSNFLNVKDSKTSLNSRYRTLILSIILFLSLISALLAYTFYTSRILQQNTALINVSNHIANNAQSVIKDLFDMQNSYGEDITSPHIVTVLKRLKDNSENIDKNLADIESGNSIVDEKGNKITLPIINDKQTLDTIANTKEQWNQLKPKVEDYLKVANNIEADSSTALGIAGEQAKTSSLAMNDSLNALTNDVFSQAENQANNIRLIQLLGVATILGYFAIFIFFFVRRLRESDEQAQIAQRETQDIMANVNTGLFLLDKDLNIGNQYSNQLENIIGETKVAGKNLTGLLKNKVSGKDLETTQSFVKQLYNPRVKEKLVDDLNPLRKVMISDNKNQSRFLDFKFSRVYDQNQIEKILVNVQDVTQQVRLEQRLEQERAQNDLQIEMLTTILNVNPALINEFIGNTQQNIVKINNILKAPGSQQHELEEKLNGMYRIMHSLKGEASVLKLHSFIQIASDFEEKLKGLQNKGTLSGNDFLPLTIHLDELLNLSNTIDSLGKRINQGAANANTAAVAMPTTMPMTTPAATVTPATTTETFAPIASNGQYDTFDVMNDSPMPAPTAVTTPTATPVAGKNQLYQQFADSIALRQNKDVILKAKGFNEIQLPRDMDSTLKEIVIQLIRNAVVHGIETPEQRIQAGKPAQGTIKLTFLDLSENYKLTMEDDGQGIDYNAIRERAVEMGYNAGEVAQWDKPKLTSLLFKSGFSTRSSHDEDAGRGVGMDIIKERVNDLHGHLTLDTQQGQFTRFVIKIPKNPVL